MFHRLGADEPRWSQIGLDRQGLSLMLVLWEATMPLQSFEDNVIFKKWFVLTTRHVVAN